VWIASVLAALLAAAPAGGTSGAAPDGPARDRFQNPKNLDAYIAEQESPGRAAWQKPEEILDALSIAPGQTVCDIGAGPGYFALRVAKRVGPTGRVFAVDVEPKILDVLRTRIEKAGARNVTPVLALADDPLLPPRSCDLVLIIDAYHHFSDRHGYLRRVVPLMRPGARLANVDWHKRPTAIGPEQGHRVSREQFLGDATRAGLRLVAEPKFLPNHYFLILTAK
jgi:ubiquinone/menaquinone biosynthesis C-methylase UbiE